MKILFFFECFINLNKYFLKVFDKNYTQSTRRKNSTYVFCDNILLFFLNVKITLIVTNLSTLQIQALFK